MTDKILLKKFESPTDIYILGDSNTDLQECSFMLTDDECSLEIKRGRSSVMITTYGFGYILTTEEMVKYIDTLGYESGADGVYIEQFEGSIYAVVESESGEVKFKENATLDDYLYYQTTAEHEDIEITLLIEDTKSWISYFFYKPFSIDMLSKLVGCVKLGMS